MSGTRIQGQKVRSTRGGRVKTGEGYSQSVTSSFGLLRARKQRAFFDGSQHAPLPPGPSAQRVRAGLLGPGRSECRCAQSTRPLEPHP